MRKAVDKIVAKTFKPLEELLRLEAAGGLLLMAAAVLALLVANSPLEASYEGFLKLPIEIRIGTFAIAKPLILWVNDGLMAIFFLLVGMELKREVLEGHLSSLKAASLPAFAALGGMLGPALIYVAFNSGDAVALKGWAIPTATDIAFALGVLMLLGDRVPVSLKVFLLSIAIFDDLGAIVVIALFYTDQLSEAALTFSALLVAVLAVMNWLGVLRKAAYFVVGIPLWVALLKSGVHATLAGVVLGFCIPLRRPAHLPKSAAFASPLHIIEHSLHPWVAYGVLPLFAFANAGVAIPKLTMDDFLHPVPVGIAAGLVLGKQLGVMSFCFLAVRLRLASLGKGLRWSHVYGVSLLCGVGFTMSLFIASLAFEQGGEAYYGLDRLGILVASVISGIAGYLVLRAVLKGDQAQQNQPAGARKR